MTSRHLPNRAARRPPGPLRRFGYRRLHVLLRREGQVVIPTKHGDKAPKKATA